jgi:RHS repeat-associated protein
VVMRPDGTQIITHPDGSVITQTLGPDPRWGMLDPILTSLTVRMPSGLTQTITKSRTVTLANANDPMTLQTLTDRVGVNGQVTTRAYNASTRTATETTAGGRSSSITLDAHGDVAQVVQATGIAAIIFTHDSAGRVTRVAQGSQLWNYTYDALNRLTSRTDAAGNLIQYGYDLAGRLTTLVLPGGATYSYSYDADGNRTQVTMPNGSVHSLTSTLLDQTASYTPPGNASYTWSYDLDRALTAQTLPGGRAIANTFDAGGRVTGENYAEAALLYAYAPSDPTSRVSTIQRTPLGGPAQDLLFTYNGELVSRMTVNGAAAAQYDYIYDNRFLPTSLRLVSSPVTVTLPLTWDADRLPTGYGPFTLTRGGPGGALSRVSDGTLNLTLGYDTLARISSSANTVATTQAYSSQLTYGNRGLITRKVETVSGTAHTYDYAYDPTGQLLSVTRDGTVVEQYTYDGNGNRTSRRIGAGPVETATYDPQDRVQQQGSVTYAFNNDGLLTGRGSDTFTYGAKGELLQTTVGGQTITYVYDGLGRQVARTDSTGTHEYFYANIGSLFEVTAMRSPTGTFTFFYYDERGFLIGLERGGSRYYVATDQVGTPRVVSNAAGQAVKVLEYDTFGALVSDSNPAFELPVGFAGGLEDRTTGLVRFGFRDYDPAAGRWTARDPVFYGGGQSNLYVYVSNNPVSLRDPEGLWCISATAYAGVGGGGTFCKGDDGWSVCAEVGLGAGGSVGVSTGGTEQNGTQIEAELSAGCGPLGAGVGCTFDECGLGCKAKADVGPVEVDSSGEVTVSKGTTNALDIAGKLKCSVGGKIAGKACVKVP